MSSADSVIESKPVKTDRAATPTSERFQSFIGQGWAERMPPAATSISAAEYAANRRATLSAAFPGKRIIIPAGSPKQRANDTDYPFRAHSDFAYLTGWGADSEPGAVLVLEPSGAIGHAAHLYFRERAGRDSSEFYANSVIGEFWIGPRPTVADVTEILGITTHDISALTAALDNNDHSAVIIREADQAITARVDQIRPSANIPQAQQDDAELAQFLSEQRLIKDDYEVSELRQAIAATARGFEDVLSALPRAVRETRGERLIEGVFTTRARLEGNDVGYSSIAAAGSHSTILHWTRNDGSVMSGDLVLLDAGVELDSYYTADITRTFPVDGTFSPIQRQIYEAVLEAADAAFALVRPGAIFREIHAAAMSVIARKTAEWGLLPITLEETLQPDVQFHRRYMVHGTSHHLGLDVHDCAQARREFYLDGVLARGMVFTIEPGLYFQPDDLTVPEEFRGIGVRIEDNILVTDSGAENLSAAIPRTAAAIEKWVQQRRERFSA